MNEDESERSEGGDEQTGSGVDSPDAPVVEEFEEPKRIPLTDLFGDNPRVKLLDLFVSSNQDTLSASEIAEFCGIDTSTVRSSLDVFIENEVIEETGTVGYSPMYRLNTENPVAAAIEDLEGALEEITDDGEPARENIWEGGTDDESTGDDGGAWSNH